MEVAIENGTLVSTHSRPKAAAVLRRDFRITQMVSTHSRPKAAALAAPVRLHSPDSFNSQPPEDGCL